MSHVEPVSVADQPALATADPSFPRSLHSLRQGQTKAQGEYSSAPVPTSGSATHSLRTARPSARDLSPTMAAESLAPFPHLPCKTQAPAPPGQPPGPGPIRPLPGGEG